MGRMQVSRFPSRHATTWLLALAPAVGALASRGPATAAEQLTLPPASAVPRRAEEPEEVEVITLEGDPELDRQRYAVGAEAGAGWFDTRGSGRGEPGADFGIVGAFGLGTNGSRVPLTVDVFASFAVTRASLGSSVAAHPERFTRFGARLVYRASGGFFEHRWISAGLGAVFTSWDRPDDRAPDVLAACRTGTSTDCSTPSTALIGLLVDLGFGLHEWTTRSARYGFGLRVPIEASVRPGVGVIGLFYAQIGLGG